MKEKKHTHVRSFFLLFFFFKVTPRKKKEKRKNENAHEKTKKKCIKNTHTSTTHIPKFCAFRETNNPFLTVAVSRFEPPPPPPPPKKKKKKKKKRKEGAIDNALERCPARLRFAPRRRALFFDDITNRKRQTASLREL